MKNLSYGFLIVLITFFCTNNAMKNNPMKNNPMQKNPTKNNETRIKLVPTENTQETNNYVIISKETASKMRYFNMAIYSKELSLHLQGSFTSIKLFATLLSQEKPEISHDIHPKNVCEITNMAYHSQASDLQNLLLKYMRNNINIFRDHIHHLDPELQCNGQINLSHYDNTEETPIVHTKGILKFIQLIKTGIPYTCGIAFLSLLFIFMKHSYNPIMFHKTT
jgi:hypothetical protein